MWDRMVRSASRSLVSMMGWVLLIMAAAFTLLELAGAVTGANVYLTVLLWVLAAVCLWYDAFRSGQQKRLVEAGCTVRGKVTAVRRRGLTRISFGTSNMGPGAFSPYVVYFEYTAGGAVYTGCSEWVWYEPAVKAGDSVEVYIDEARPQRAVCKL